MHSFLKNNDKQNKDRKKNGNYSVIQHVTPIPYRRGLDLVIKYNNKERNKHYSSKPKHLQNTIFISPDVHSTSYLPPRVMRQPAQSIC